jgi:hypothetical protein
MMLLSVISVSTANAAFPLVSENFEGTFPPSGWEVTEDDPTYSYVVWHRSDQSPNYAAGSIQPPISGFFAYAESYPAYCGYSYDTSLISPSFSTVGMDAVEVQFDFQFWKYSSESMDLDYRIGAGPWVNLETLPSIGGYTPQTRIVDISVTKGNPSVQLRWRYYYNSGSTCDWWASIDNVVIYEPNSKVAVPIMSRLGMIIFTILAGLGAFYCLSRRKAES